MAGITAPVLLFQDITPFSPGSPFGPCGPAGPTMTSISFHSFPSLTFNIIYKPSYCITTCQPLFVATAISSAVKAFTPPPSVRLPLPVLKQILLLGALGSDTALVSGKELIVSTALA